jgi:Abortive infection alpha
VSEEPDESLLAALPGIARIAASTAWHTTELWLGAYVRAGRRVVRAALNGEPPGVLLEDTRAAVRGYARELLNLAEETPPASVDGHDQTLRERGEELLRRSADVDYEEDAHPAYDRILSELAPDEGRILRLLATEGAQPSVDVRAGLPMVTHLVAPGLNMIGAEAGARYGERVPAYLNNLYRLGLIWFSREPLEPHRYQVLEAQPDVLAALRSSRQGRTIRRSINLTPFGQDFCQTCLPLHTSELEQLPGATSERRARASR